MSSAPKFAALGVLLAPLLSWLSSAAPASSAAYWALGALLLATLFHNPLWRLLVMALAQALAADFALALAPPLLARLALCALVALAPHLLAGAPQPAAGHVVFVTGCDSGMGYHTALRLASAGYTVVAGCYMREASDAKLKDALAHDEEAQARLSTVALDVTKDESVDAARDAVAASAAYAAHGLAGVVNCAGVGHNGPAEYFPLALYQKQFEVNCFGYIRVAQAFLPMLRASAAKPGGRRGRLVFFGTGGGACSPVPPLLSAYMASKLAVEAFCHSLRQELQLTGRRVDVCMVNPGFIKPTGLMAGGLALHESMWAACAEATGDGRAQAEYGALLKQFVAFSEEQPGTNVSVVADVMEGLMAAPRPRTSYKVGPDSGAAPFVGMLPTGLREFIVKGSMYKQWQWQAPLSAARARQRWAIAPHAPHRPSPTSSSSHISPNHHRRIVAYVL